MSGFQAAAVSGSVMILVIAMLRLTAGKRLPRAVRGGVSAAAAGAAAVRAERLESDRR